MEEVLEMLQTILQIYLLWCLYDEEVDRRRRWWVRPINMNRDEKGYFVTTFLPMKEKDPEEFIKQTRMDKATYDILLCLMEEQLTKKCIRTPISSECRLALTLSWVPLLDHLVGIFNLLFYRFLSQGVSLQYLAWSFKMGKSTVRKIILETCNKLWEVLFPIYVARPNESDYVRIAADFNNLWNMPNCVGAIDGKHINIQAPPKSGSLYFNYKKHFSIVMLAACDGRYSFTDVSVGAYGSQSDGGMMIVAHKNYFL